MGSGHSIQTTLSHGLKPPAHPAFHGTYSSTTTTTTVTSSSTLGEGGSELTGLARQLAINWVIFDKEFDLIAYCFISYLLQAPCETASGGGDCASTSGSAKVQRTRSGACMHASGGQACAGPPSLARSPAAHDELRPADVASPETAGADDVIAAPTATADTSNNTSSNHSGGNPGGTGVSATLRAGVLSLDVVGMRRVIDVLAYIAAGCQSREDRINAAVALGECEAGASSRLPLGLLGSTMPGMSATPHLVPHILVSNSTNEGSATWSAYSLGSRHFSQTTSASQSMNLAGATMQLQQQYASRAAAPPNTRPEASPSPARYHIAAVGPTASAAQQALVVPLYLSPLLHEHSYNAGLLLTVQATTRVSFGNVSPALSRHPSASLAYARRSPSRSTTPKTLTELSAAQPTPPAPQPQSPFVAPQHPAVPPSNHNPRRLSGGALTRAPPPPTTTMAAAGRGGGEDAGASDSGNGNGSKSVMQAQLPGGDMVYYCTPSQDPKRGPALATAPLPSSSSLATLFNDLTDDRGAGLRGMTAADAVELLCTTFAHLQFTDIDVVNFVVGFVDTVYEVQARALAAAHKIVHPHRGGGGRLAGSSDNVLTTMTSASMSSRAHALNASSSQPPQQQYTGNGGSSSSSSRLVLLPYLERYVLPYYQHYLRVLAFVSGCEKALPLLLRQPCGSKGGGGGSTHVYPPSTAARSSMSAEHTLAVPTQGHLAATTSPRPSHSLASGGNSLTSAPAGGAAMTSQAPREHSRESGGSVTSLPVGPRGAAGPAASGTSRAGMRAAAESCSTGLPSGGPTSVTAIAEGATPELISTVLDESEVVMTPSVSLLSNPLGPSSTRMQCSQAHQYFREQCPMLVDYAASAATFSSASGTSAGKPGGTGGGSSASSSSTTMLAATTSRMAGGRGGSSGSSTSNTGATSPGYGYSHQYSAGAARYRAEMLSMKSDYVLHYAEVVDEQCINASLSLSSLSPSSSAVAQGVVSGYGDAFACMNGEPLWPLASRLLMLRGQYLYLYDAVATTIGALGGNFNISAGGSGGGGGGGGLLAREMNSPVALLSLSNAMESDFCIIGEVDETEIVHMGPSRTVRGQRGSGDEGAGAAAARTGAAAQGSHFVVPSSANSSRSNVTTGSQRGAAVFFRGSSNEDVHVYRMEHRQHGIFLLCLPVGLTPSHYENAGQAASVNVAWSQYAAAPGARTVNASNANSNSGADRVGNRAGDEAAGRARQGISRHGLMGTSTATPRTAPDAGRDAGEFFYSPRMSEFAPVAANEVIALTVYPLRVYCKGVLHHLFFQSASARAEWRHRLTVLSTCTQSRAHLARLAAAPQCVEAFVRRRISFPVVPDAFDYLDMLGVGTFGRVLLVRHKLTGRLFALKIIRKTGFHGIRNVIEVRRERRILDALDCPYIMRIHASFQTDSRVYLLLDYLPGGELLMHTQRAPQHHFNEECSRFFIAELAIAVEHLRQHGILHRDIKGDNLVLDEGGHVVLSDFGFAKKVTVPISDEAAAATTETDRVLYLFGPSGEKLAQKVVPQHTSCGTLAYIAPEILHSARKARGYGLEVDWWSTGVVLFTVMTGYFPFLKAHHHETSNAIVNNPLQFPPRSNISEAAQNLLQRLIDKDPTRRISSLAQLKQHYFFHGFDWEACEQRRMRPPVLLHKDTYRKAISISTATERLRQRVITTLLASNGHSGGEGNLHPPQQHETISEEACLLARSVGPVGTSKEGGAPAVPVPSNKRYAEEFAEELRELRLVQLAYGADAAPEPTSYENDVFGDIFERQEECGSDRGQDDDTNLEQEINTEYIPSTTLLPPRQAVASPLHAAAATSRAGGPSAFLLPHSDVVSAFSCNNNNNYHVVGNASLPAAHEGGNGGGSHHSVAASNALCELADGLEPVTEDFNEMAYASMSNIRHVCATEASLADTSLYRPVCEL